MEQAKHKKGLIFVVLAPMLWGFSGTLAQSLFDKGVEAEWLVNIRLVFSGLFVLLYSLLVNGSKQTFAVWRRRKDWLHQLVFSIFGMMAVQLSYFMAIAHSDSATATVLQFTNAVMISFVVAVTSRSWPRRVEVISLVMAILGVLLLVTDGHFTELKISPLGLFWGLLSAVGAVTYTLLPASLIQRFGAIPVVGWGMLLGGLCFNLYRPMWQGVPTLDSSGVLVILAVIFFGTIFPFILFLQGLSYVKPTIASMFGSMEPLTATVLTILFFKTVIGWPQIIGMTLVLATVFIQALDQPRALKIKKQNDP